MPVYGVTPASQFVVEAPLGRDKPGAAGARAHPARWYAFFLKGAVASLHGERQRWTRQRAAGYPLRV
jgi:hypothetical protein